MSCCCCTNSLRGYRSRRPPRPCSSPRPCSPVYPRRADLFTSVRDNSPSLPHIGGLTDRAPPCFFTLLESLAPMADMSAPPGPAEVPAAGPPTSASPASPGRPLARLKTPASPSARGLPALASPTSPGPPVMALPSGLVTSPASPDPPVSPTMASPTSPGPPISFSSQPTSHPPPLVLPTIVNDAATDSSPSTPSSHSHSNRSSSSKSIKSLDEKEEIPRSPSHYASARSSLDPGVETSALLNLPPPPPFNLDVHGLTVGVPKHSRLVK